MNNSISEPSELYLKTLLQYYEEEVVGETYFYTLAKQFEETEKTILLARVERRAANAVVPLLEKYQLIPRTELDMKKEGRADTAAHDHYSWIGFMEHILDRYPGYLDDFSSLEAMAPAADLEAIKILTDHEVAVIDFAKREIAGDPGSIEPLLSYLV